MQMIYLMPVSLTAREKVGLCFLAANKKKPFFADPKFLKYKGFSVCDEADCGIQLWYQTIL